MSTQHTEPAKPGFFTASRSLWVGSSIWAAILMGCLLAVESAADTRPLTSDLSPEPAATAAPEQDECELVITSPGTGDQVVFGEPFLIEWTFTETCGESLFVSIEDVNSDVCPMGQVQNSGSFLWDGRRCASGTLLRIKLFDSTTGAVAQSGDFTLVSPTTTVSVPEVGLSAYRLWSIPVRPTVDGGGGSPTMSDVLTPILGAEMGLTSWRGFGLRSTENVPNPAVETGRGYWLNTVIPIPEGQTLDGVAQVPQSIRLVPGYNIVAAPSEDSLSLATVRVRPQGGDSLTIEEAVEANYLFHQLAEYVDNTPNLINDGEWIRTPIAGASIGPWDGRVVFVNPSAGEGLDLLYGLAASSGGGTARALDSMEEPVWSLRVRVHGRLSRVDVVEVGARHGSEFGFDEWDAPKPPLPGQNLELGVAHLDWDRFPSLYEGSFAPAGQAAYRWTLRAQGVEGDLRFTWEGLVGLPNELQAYLILPSGAAVPLRPGGSFTAPTTAGQLTLDLLLTEAPWEGPMVTSGFTVVRSVTPTPWSGGPVLITYEVVGPEADASLRLFDAQGRRVKEFGRVPSEVGTWDVGWDGKGDNGRYLAPGVYFLRLAVGGHPFTSRFVVLK